MVILASCLGDHTIGFASFYFIKSVPVLQSVHSISHLLGEVRLVCVCCTFIVAVGRTRAI